MEAWLGNSIGNTCCAASLDDGTAAAILDEAESIINAVFGEVVADMNDKRKNKKKNRDKKKKK